MILAMISNYGLISVASEGYETPAEWDVLSRSLLILSWVRSDNKEGDYCCRIGRFKSDRW